MKLSEQIGALLEIEDFDMIDFIGALVLIKDRAIILETERDKFKEYATHKKWCSIDGDDVCACGFTQITLEESWVTQCQ